MKSSILIVISSVFLIMSALVSAQSDKAITARIDLNEKGTPISPKIFGMFIEHLGNKDVGDILDDGLWSEILDDRKFYYPIDNSPEQKPKNFRDNPNQWAPLKGSQVIMDSLDSYVGVHSPKVITEKGVDRGIYQSGLIIRSGIQFNGRIVLKAMPGVTIKVILKSGKFQSEKIIKGLTTEYQTYDFQLSLQVFQKEAQLIISGEGNGSFHIGAVSLMPEDNVRGYRADVIHLLKELNSGIYRWGGNFSSGYDFRDGIGNPDLRPPRWDYAWNALENNDVGPDELVDLAELVNVDLSMTVNGGFGDANSAADFVEYMNGSINTEMGAIRAKNGHPKPYNIKYWCVGNESYGWWQLGHTDLKYHIIKHNMFAEKMKEVDSNIVLIASGASIEEMTVTENSKRTTGKVLAEYDTPSDWTGGLLRGALENIDFVSEHFYCSVNERFDIDSGKYIQVDEPLVEWTRRPANRVKAKSNHYKYYRENIPGAANIPVYLDEWAYYNNWIHSKPTMGVTLGYARALNEIFRNSDLIKMAGMTFCTSCLSFNDTAVIYNSNGELYRFYESGMGLTPLKVSGDLPQPEPYWPIGGGQPPINAGSDTYPLDVFASQKEDGTITVSVVNPTESELILNLEIPGNKKYKPSNYKSLAGKTDARNIVGQKAEVKRFELPINSLTDIKIKPASVNIIQLKLED